MKINIYILYHLGKLGKNNTNVFFKDIRICLYIYLYIHRTYLSAGQNCLHKKGTAYPRCPIGLFILPTILLDYSQYIDTQPNIHLHLV